MVCINYFLINDCLLLYTHTIQSQQRVGGSNKDTLYACVLLIIYTTIQVFLFGLHRKKPW